MVFIKLILINIIYNRAIKGLLRKTKLSLITQNFREVLVC